MDFGFARKAFRWGARAMKLFSRGSECYGAAFHRVGLVWVMESLPCIYDRIVEMRALRAADDGRHTTIDQIMRKADMCSGTKFWSADVCRPVLHMQTRTNSYDYQRKRNRRHNWERMWR
ncbi:unnamed protein product [Citrullus colocynthis]|uniref:Uncharacterized protein n=1 Tax=Citrullus colocynthis TaxID=252529 RepID=A0ABP0XZV2_9ROSI